MLIGSPVVFRLGRMAGGYYFRLLWGQLCMMFWLLGIVGWMRLRVQMRASLLRLSLVRLVLS